MIPLKEESLLPNLTLIDCDQIHFRRPITWALRMRNLEQVISPDKEWLSQSLKTLFVETYAGQIKKGDSFLDWFHQQQKRRC